MSKKDEDEGLAVLLECQLLFDEFVQKQREKLQTIKNPATRHTVEYLTFIHIVLMLFRAQPLLILDKKLQDALDKIRTNAETLRDGATHITGEFDPMKVVILHSEEDIEEFRKVADENAEYRMPPFDQNAIGDA